MSKLMEQFTVEEIDHALGEVAVFVKSEINGPVRYFYWDVKEDTDVFLYNKFDMPLKLETGIHCIVVTAVLPYRYITHYGPEDMHDD